MASGVPLVPATVDLPISAFLVLYGTQVPSLNRSSYRDPCSWIRTGRGGPPFVRSPSHNLVRTHRSSWRQGVPRRVLGSVDDAGPSRIGTTSILLSEPPLPRWATSAAL